MSTRHRAVATIAVEHLRLLLNLSEGVIVHHVYVDHPRESIAFVLAPSESGDPTLLPEVESGVEAPRVPVVVSTHITARGDTIVRVAPDLSAVQ